MSDGPLVAVRTEVARVAARHALGWLVAANAVGLLATALLLWPGLNESLAPLTYGRWMPLHLDWQLYGACALPLVATLLAWCIDARHPGAVVQARVALAAWSLALALGGVAWLNGVVSGKLFLEWHGWARPLLPAAMLVLWTVLAAHVWWRRDELGRGANLARVLLMGALLIVPGALYWSFGREVYPSANPDSGGATGARLLASTLGIVTTYGFLGEALGITRPAWRSWFWTYLVFSICVCGAIEHGNVSHHEPAQVAGLATLAGWLPLGWLYFRGEDGQPAARRWWAAAFLWWAALIGSGLWTFWPGVSERMKFSNSLVAHAHLAMAGLVVSANLAVLVELRALNAARGFWLWQGASIALVAVLLALGAGEAGNEAALYFAEPWTLACGAVRLVAGAGMLLASFWWWRDSGQVPEVRR
jgi:cytochrome c oxidase cbb3-type subunit 1